MIEEISKLISENKIEEALALLSKLIEESGFTDTVAVLSATINSVLGDEKNALDVIEQGLNFNSKNYELHFMKANLLADNHIEEAFNEYELSKNYCLYEVGEDNEDYKYIRDVFLDYKCKNQIAIKNYIDSLPVLLYKSDEICFGILNKFVDIMASNLEKLGENIEIIDLNITPPEELYKICGRRYKGIIGVQTYAFSIFFTDGRNIHDFILGPKLNILFDHPCCMYNHFTKAPKDCVILTHDRNYVKFIEKQYPNIKAVEILPPGGLEYDVKESKDKDLVFIGSYKSEDTWDGVIKELDGLYHNLASKLVSYMKENPNETYESCVNNIFGENVDTKVYFDLKQTYFKVMSDYRTKILKCILDAGIDVDVYGDSWNIPLWNSYQNIHIHPDITLEESLKEYGSSYTSLNIMSWHKDGRTERVANSMLNHSLVITDKTQYLMEEYQDDENIMMFDLSNYQDLPERIKHLISNKARITQMADKAYSLACKNETWEKRTKDLKTIVEKYMLYF